MTSNPVVCFILKGKERMGEEAPDSQGEGAGEVPFTVGSRHPSRHTLLGRTTLRICCLGLHSVQACVWGEGCVWDHICAHVCMG